MCKTKHKLDTVTKVCTSVSNSVANCSEWTDENSCDSCEKGYYYEGGKCNEITKVDNCKEMN